MKAAPTTYVLHFQNGRVRREGAGLSFFYKEADSRAYALEANLKPVRDVDWRTLMAISPHAGEAKTMIAMAFQEMAANAQKIGELNISPDLLRSLVASTNVSPAASAPAKGK